MSKTTLRKRISLVAVTALTAGVLSVVSAPVASANIAGSATGSTNQAVATTEVLSVATIASTTGAVVSSSANSAIAGAAKSLGLVYKDASSATAQSATMISTGALALYTTIATTATITSITATGGKFTACNDQASGATSNSGACTVAADQSNVVYAASATLVSVAWTPGAVGTYTLKMYKSVDASQTTTTYPSRGTLIGQVVVTVTATSVAGTYSATYSLCNLDTSATAASSTSTDASGSSKVANGSYGYINFTIKDAYRTEISAGDVLSASATNGALIGFGSTPGAGSTAISTSDNSSTITIGQPTSNSPVTTTVTLTFNGTTVCTKTVTIFGEVAKLVVTPLTTQNLSTSTWTDANYGLSGGVFAVDTLDSAGNKVIPASASMAQVSGTANTVVTAVSIGTYATGIAATDSLGLWPLNSSLGLATCSSTAGTNSGLKIRYSNSSGTTIDSPAFTVRCAGAPVSYKASLDKASYKQGEIATLTVQFLDVAGNNAASLTTGATAGVISLPQMVRVGADPSANKVANINGVVTHTYTVGTATGITEGSYSGYVTYGSVNSLGGTAQTVGYTVAATTASVSNADVLKSIVALIASINKQIQALQKLILKR